jgi:chromate reductase
VTYCIVALSGSVRAGSANTGLVRMAQRLAPPALAIDFYTAIDQLPWYDPDLEPDPPPAVRDFRAAIAPADGVLLASPEYNFGPTGLMKNAVDWATRPFGQGVLKGKIVTVVTSGGKGGGKRGQGFLNDILAMLGNTVVTEPEVAIPLGLERINADGTTSDPEIEAVLGARLAALVAALEAR